MRGHPSRKATFLMQKGWPHKRGSTNKSYFQEWYPDKSHYLKVWVLTVDNEYVKRYTSTEVLCKFTPSRVR